MTLKYLFSDIFHFCNVKVLQWPASSNIPGHSPSLLTREDCPPLPRTLPTHLLHQLTNPAKVDGLLPAKQQELVDSVGHHGLVGVVVWCYLQGASPLLKQGRGRCQCCGARLEWRHIAEAGDRDHRLNQHKVLVMGVALLTHLSSCTTVLPVLDNIAVAWMNSILSRIYFWILSTDWIMQVLVQVWEVT